MIPLALIPASVIDAERPTHTETSAAVASTPLSREARGLTFDPEPDGSAPLVRASGAGGFVLESGEHVVLAGVAVDLRRVDRIQWMRLAIDLPGAAPIDWLPRRVDRRGRFDGSLVIEDRRISRRFIEATDDNTDAIAPFILSWRSSESRVVWDFSVAADSELTVPPTVVLLADARIASVRQTVTIGFRDDRGAERYAAYPPINVPVLTAPMPQSD